MAKSLELSRSGSKQVIYDRIKSHIELELQLEKERENFIESSKLVTNSFNKHQPELEYKNVTILEFLFWKVFRNKYIYKSIFSNFKYSKIFRYEDIFCSEEAIKYYSNGIYIIKDKLQHSQQIIKNNDEFILIFGKLKKDISLNREIIQLIFNNYKSNSLSESFNNHQLWIKILINSLNTIALDMYINQFKISEQSLKQIISVLEKTDSLFPVETLYKSFPMIEHLNRFIPESKYLQYINDNAANYIIYINQLIKFYNYNSKNINKIYNNSNKKEMIIYLNEGVSISKEYKSYPISKFTEDCINFSTVVKYIMVLKEAGSIFRGNRWGQYLNYIEKKSTNVKSVYIDQQNDYGILKSRLIDAINNNTISYCDFLKILYDFFEIGRLDIIKFLFDNYSIDNIVNKVRITYIISRIKDIKLLDFYYGRYKDRFFFDGSTYWMHVTRVSVLKYYFELMNLCNYKFTIIKINFYISMDINLLIELLNNPTSYKFESKVDNIIESYGDIVKVDVYKFGPESIINIFKTSLFKTINLSQLFKFILNNYDRYTHKNKNVVDLLMCIFNDISLEDIIKYISTDIIHNNNNIINIPINISLLNIKNQNKQNNYNSNNSKINNIIFSIHIKDFLIYMGIIGRSNDALYIMNTIPNLKFISFPFCDCGIQKYSNELLDSYIIILFGKLGEPDNNTVILYYYLKVAAQRGLISTFKKVIYLYNNNIFKKKSKSNNNIFTEQQLIDIINESTKSHNYELTHFLINYSSIDIKRLK